MPNSAILSKAQRADIAKRAIFARLASKPASTLPGSVSGAVYGYCSGIRAEFEAQLSLVQTPAQRPVAPTRTTLKQSLIARLDDKLSAP
jgi:hypothetical protein